MREVLEKFGIKRPGNQRSRESALSVLRLESEQVNFTPAGVFKFMLWRFVEGRVPRLIEKDDVVLLRRVVGQRLHVLIRVRAGGPGRRVTGVCDDAWG